jgi:hypothetical protein
MNEEDKHEKLTEKKMNKIESLTCEGKGKTILYYLFITISKFFIYYIYNE